VTAPLDSTQHVEKLADQLTALRDSFKNLRALNDYGTAAIKIMNDSAGTIDHTTIVAMQAKFKKSLADLKALTPPDKAKTFHKAKLDAYAAMTTDIDDAVAALNKNDNNSYTTAIEKLANDAKTASTSTAAKELNTFYNEYYNDLGRAYDTLATTLGV
jgi:sulfite reductase alpha subunit-like flavoprotein